MSNDNLGNLIVMQGNNEILDVPKFKILRRSHTTSAFLIYYAFLCISYSLEISDKWDSMGFDFKLSPWGILLSIFSILIFSRYSDTGTHFRRLAIKFYIFSVFVPSLVLMSFGNTGISHGAIYASSLALIIIFSSVPLPTFRPITLNVSVLVVLLLLGIGSSVIMLAYNVGIKNLSFEIYSVYDNRREFAEDIGSTLNRSLSLITKFFLPLLFIYGLSLKGGVKFFVTVFALICTILIFGYWQHKSALFFPIAVVCMYLFFGKGGSDKKLVFIFVSLSAVLCSEAVAYAVAEIKEPAVLNNFLARRALILPALLTEHYFEFFSSNPKFYWYALTQHIGVAGPGYDMAPAKLIGYVYFGELETSANVGLVGSGYANAGIAGVLWYSVLAGLIIGILDSYAKMDRTIFVFCLTIPVLHTVFASSDLITVLLSHGLLFVLFMIPFLKTPAPKLMR